MGAADVVAVSEIPLKDEEPSFRFMTGFNGNFSSD